MQDHGMGYDDERTVGEMRAQRSTHGPPSTISDDDDDVDVDDDYWDEDQESSRGFKWVAVDAEISDDDDIIAHAIATGKTQKEAGALINRSARTVRHHLEKPAVQHRVEDYSRENLDRFVSTLQAALPEAVRTLTDALSSETPAVSLRAARDLVSSGTRLREQQLRLKPKDDQDPQEWSAALHNIMEACAELLPRDVLQQLADRITTMNEATELIARGDPRIERQPRRIRFVLEEQEPSNPEGI
jgi:hypothetical protein